MPVPSTTARQLASQLIAMRAGWQGSAMGAAFSTSGRLYLCTMPLVRATSSQSAVAAMHTIGSVPAVATACGGLNSLGGRGCGRVGCVGEKVGGW